MFKRSSLAHTCADQLLMSVAWKAVTSVTARCNDSTLFFPPLLSSQIPLCRVIRFNIDYTIHFIEEMTPEVGINCSPLPSLTPFLFKSPMAEANLHSSVPV